MECLWDAEGWGPRRGRQGSAPEQAPPTRPRTFDPSLGGGAFPAEPRRRAEICFFLTNKRNVVVLAIAHRFRDERTVALVAGGAAALCEEARRQEHTAIATKGRHRILAWQPSVGRPQS